VAEVRAEQLLKLFKSHQETVRAVDSIDVHIPDHEFAVFVGPSGSGKTTFLRLVAGLEVPTSGRITIGDRDVTTLHPRERGIAMVFQDYALYPHMTVAQNMSFALENLKFPKAEIQQRVLAAARLLQMENLLGRKPRQLSGGQRQRVALGRAIVRKPQVFLFDEPLSNLDAKLRAQMRVELADLHRQLETTAIYVTHDQVEAVTLGDRIFVMNDGLVQQVANGDELYNAPANVFVASFIGTPQINLISAQLVSDPGGLAVSIGGQRVAVPAGAENAARAWAGQEVILGIRPEAVVLGNGAGSVSASAANGTASESSSLRASVRLVEHLGSELLAHFEVAGNPLVARLPADAGIRAGETCDISVNLSKSHLFDPASQRRIVTGVVPAAAA
jgi:multiple sugar transport system ATP-binding protein